MKHRLLLLLLFVFTAVMTGWAQNSATPSYTIKGVLLDSLTQEGEPYATIKITKKGAPDKAIKMAVTGASVPKVVAIVAKGRAFAGVDRSDAGVASV